MKAIDQVIDTLRNAFPGVHIEQLKVKYPADDDGLWFVNHPNSEASVQIESSSGEYPFLIEYEETRITTQNLNETVDAVIRGLGFSASLRGRPGLFETGTVQAWVEQQTIHLIANKPPKGDSAELSAADARRLADALLKMAGQLQH